MTLGSDLPTFSVSSPRRPRIAVFSLYRGTSRSSRRENPSVNLMRSAGVTRRCAAGFTHIPAMAGHSVPNAEFCELTADYFGLPIPVCVRDASVRVPGARGADKFVGPWGAALMSTNAKGDGWTLQHDVGKHLQWTEFKDHGVRSSMELYSLFGDVFDNLRNANPLRWGVASPHQHRGAVPDIDATFLGERRQLYEVKCMHKNPSCYPHCAHGGAMRMDERCACRSCSFRIGGAKSIEKRTNSQQGRGHQAAQARPLPWWLCSRLSVLLSGA